MNLDRGNSFTEVDADGTAANGSDAQFNLKRGNSNDTEISEPVIKRQELTKLLKLKSKLYVTCCTIYANLFQEKECFKECPAGT